eukprot:5198651-Prymnesium_polylepis.1
MRRACQGSSAPKERGSCRRAGEHGRERSKNRCRRRRICGCGRRAYGSILGGSRTGRDAPACAPIAGASSIRLRRCHFAAAHWLHLCNQFECRAAVLGAVRVAVIRTDAATMLTSTSDTGIDACVANVDAIDARWLGP